ncbi:hypothetical protein F5Y10DRAFT_291360 [Nemania abortiva]|nr:hypothetical protein F5Y10DRAFT_291360 [Nemania abortiva]
MAPNELPEGAAALGYVPAAALPWLRKSQIVNLGTKFAFPPIPEDSEAYGEGGQDEWLRGYLEGTPSLDKELYVFDLLQRTRTSKLNTSALQVLLKALHEALPPKVRNRIELDMAERRVDGTVLYPRDTGPVIGSYDWFSMNNSSFDKIIEAIDTRAIPRLDSHNKEFIIWVVNTGDSGFDHYVTIVLHYTPSRISAAPPVYDRISHWSIIDPPNRQQSKSRLQRTKNRLRLLLGADLEGAEERQIWIPPPNIKDEEFSSGLVAYSVVKQLLERIGIFTSMESQYGPDDFFAPLRPWFNPDALRAEALGHAAMKAMEKMEGKMRLALFPIQGFNDGDRLGLSPEKLFDGRHDAEFHMLPPTQRTIPEVESESASEYDNSTEDSTENFTKEDYDDFYYRCKNRERFEAAAEGRRANNAAFEASRFAQRVQHEVLESPDGRIPSAYTLQKLFGLVRRATEKDQLAADLVEKISSRRYTSEARHNRAIAQITGSGFFINFDSAAAMRRSEYTEADRILRRVFTARQGRGNDDDSLAENLPAPTGEYSGPYSTGGVLATGPVPGPGKTVDTGNPKKREYEYVCTGATDETGEETYTMHVKKKQRVLLKPAKKSQKSLKRRVEWAD